MDEPADRPPPAQLLRTLPLGTRIVARYRIVGGFTDALGYLRRCEPDTCHVETRKGVVAVPLADVVAAKPVPEPPPRRPARSPDSAVPPGA